MSKTLLAVDDSATMRKVLEITFSGEDFNVITADSSQAALGKLGEKPDAVVIDTSLGGDDGYALAKEVRKKEPGAAILLLASRYAPYDAAKGKDSGADDFMDKPFDTQQMIDKVRKAILAREGAPAAAPAAAAKPAPAPAPAAAAAAPAPAAAASGVKVGRSQTLVFGDPAPSPAPAAAKPAPAAEPPKRHTPVPATPVSMGHPSTPATAAAAGSAVGASVNGHLAGKLSELGLSPSQADAVLALSREVVERVVWEVVPQLAEAIIKEEIQRLTKA
ncbi:MAG: response regulator transcription factor [Polyangiaceae bacterium]